MQTIVNKTFKEIAVGDSASVQRALQAGDVRAWAAAFGEVDMLAGPGASQGAAGIVTAILTALVGSTLPGPGTSICTTSVEVKGAVYSLFMTPLGWGWALFVWGYALAWFLVNDRVKLLAYRILDPAKARTLPDLTPGAFRQPAGTPLAKGAG